MSQQGRCLAFEKVEGDLQIALTEGVDVGHGKNERRVGYSVGWVDAGVKNADQFVENALSFGFRRWHIYNVNKLRR